MSIAGNQTITVSTVERTYSPAWSPKYANELRKGNTSVKKSVSATEASTLRFTHDANKGIERHVSSIEDEVSVNGVPKLRKVQVTLTCEADNPTEQVATQALATGYMAYLASTGVLESIFADEL